MYVCLCTCVGICRFLYTMCAYVYEYVGVFVPVYACMHAHLCVRICVYTCLYMCAFVPSLLGYSARFTIEANALLGLESHAHCIVLYCTV